MNLKDNPLIKLFSRVNLINETDLKLFHKGTRDIKEITVLVDKESDSLILDKCVQDLDEYYSLNENYSKDEHFTLVENEYLKTPPLEDDYVRYGLYKEFLKNTSVLDFGCGKGGFLKLLKENNISNDLTGLELNQTNNKNINLEGINCLFDLNNSELKFDFIFLNHVLEHLENPISVLTDLLSRLNNKGKIIIEIPHGNDFLIKKSGLVSFKDFTFWSEHLCLYTEKFIRKLFNKLNINEYHISYRQRYNLNNHINWFKEGKPGGHKIEIFEGKILEDYNKNLIRNSQTDTLMIVIGQNSEKFSKNIFKN
jgi:2-polyprenyl-3-methyl-5-hydroxy-6-metoxy-1,4-benzoquinol methylase